MANAATCVLMCQPSASNAIDPNTLPATISAIIVTNVSATTRQVFFSPSGLPM